MSIFNENMQWRYAVKKFDTTKKITAEQLDDLLEAANLAPTSYGLQPFRFLVITRPDVREKIKAAAWNQAQVTDASHLIVVCAKTGLDEAYIDDYIKRIAETRGMTVESLKGFRDMMAAGVKNMNTAWCQRQSYLALGTMLSAAAQAKIDACPMEGFDPATVDEILGLKAKGLTSTLLCAIGFRAADDSSAGYKKVRLPRGEFAVEIS